MIRKRNADGYDTQEHSFPLGSILDFSKRRTTIAHAFASALAPSEEFDQEKVEAALNALGQKNLQLLTCIYCGNLAQTWDHLENLVREGELNGYGHQLGNLVPCCRDCNSEKGGKPFRDYVSTLNLSPAEQADLITRLEKHLSLATPINTSDLEFESKDALDQFNAIRAQILKLMEEADRFAQILREKSNG